jgi:WD40 repeat protein
MNNTVGVWDLETLTPVGTRLEGHSSSVESVAMGQRQGRAVIVSGSLDKTVRVWDLETLAPVGAPLEGHSHWVQSVAVGQRQGRAVIVSADNFKTVYEWDLDNLTPTRHIVLGTPCYSVVLVDGDVVVGTAWGVLRIALL